MNKTTWVTFGLAFCCAVGAVQAETVSATAVGSTRPSACNKAKEKASTDAKWAIRASFTDEVDVSFSECSCQKREFKGIIYVAPDWECEVEARAVKK
jgi:hypothetical protein